MFEQFSRRVTTEHPFFDGADASKGWERRSRCMPTRCAQQLLSAKQPRRVAPRRTLVPIDPVAARVCSYSSTNELAAEGIVRGPAAQLVKEQANNLPHVRTSGPARLCAAGQEWFIRFADRNSRVGVLTTQTSPADCSTAYNGTLFSVATAGWFKTLSRIASA